MIPRLDRLVCNESDAAVGQTQGMSDEATTAREETAGSDGHGPRDQSPREANKEQATGRAEVSNFEIVNHWFTLAADRLEIPEDCLLYTSDAADE